MVRHLLYTQGLVGSIPAVATKVLVNAIGITSGAGCCRFKSYCPQYRDIAQW